ncbi:MAG: HAD-IA family hydrolase [Frankiales bacterium]|nr:HAD-IA family hydrolase [Frankiales bacterium]
MTPAAPVEAVVFDWGGTLTPWHSIDLVAQWYAYAQVYDPVHGAELARRLFEAEESLWRRQRDSGGAHGTGHLDDVFAACGIDVESWQHAEALQTYLEAWDPHTYTDPDVVPLLQALRADGVRTGILSNTMWPRQHHEAVLERDGVLHLVDGAVFTSETPTGKPHADSFRAALAAVGCDDPARVVFVGDRPWDDVHGAQQVGMRAILVPHSDIPLHQQVPVDVVPDGVAHRLLDVLTLVRAWNSAALRA